ncbi:MAG: 30S ribosomal protein S21, partial [Sodaliphilus sp.]|nr:30S ribosomal protein S21 [Sodaliphilus sp.]
MGRTQKRIKKQHFINQLNFKTKMIVVPVKDGENIERALKKFKRKFERTGVIKELRTRQQFDKP